MSQVVYTSSVRIDRVRGVLRRAHLPQEDQPVLFSAHSQIAEHYGLSEGDYEPHAATLDYLAAAAGG